MPSAGRNRENCDATLTASVPFVGKPTFPRTAGNNQASKATLAERRKVLRTPRFSGTHSKFIISQVGEVLMFLILMVVGSSDLSCGCFFFLF